jgi:hypothetical protein
VRSRGDAEDTRVAHADAATVERHAELGQARVDRRAVHVARQGELGRQRAPALDGLGGLVRRAAGGDVAADDQQIDIADRVDCAARRRSGRGRRPRRRFHEHRIGDEVFMTTATDEHLGRRALKQLGVSRNGVILESRTQRTRDPCNVKGPHLRALLE